MATSFDLQIYHQAILNRINIGTLSGSAHRGGGGGGEEEEEEEEEEGGGGGVG